MKDYRKAIEHYKYEISHDIFKEPVTTYATMAVEAMEARTPKDAVFEFNESNSSIHTKCPVCGYEKIYMNQVVTLAEYCQKCGQKLRYVIG